MKFLLVLKDQRQEEVVLGLKRPEAANQAVASTGHHPGVGLACGAAQGVAAAAAGAATAVHRPPGDGVGLGVNMRNRNNQTEQNHPPKSKNTLHLAPPDRSNESFTCLSNPAHFEDDFSWRKVKP
jgi:hypothetical protein